MVIKLIQLLFSPCFGNTNWLVAFGYNSIICIQVLDGPGRDRRKARRKTKVKGKPYIQLDLFYLYHVRSVGWSVGRPSGLSVIISKCRQLLFHAPSSSLKSDFFLSFQMIFITNHSNVYVIESSRLNQIRKLTILYSIYIIFRNQPHMSNTIKKLEIGIKQNRNHPQMFNVILHNDIIVQLASYHYTLSHKV